MPEHIRAGHLGAAHIGDTVTINGNTGPLHSIEHARTLLGGPARTTITQRVKTTAGTYAVRQVLDATDPVTLVDPPTRRGAVPANATLDDLVALLSARAAMWDAVAQSALDDGNITQLDEARTSAAECRFLILELTNPTAPRSPMTPGKASPRCESGGRDGCTCDICY